MDRLGALLCGGGLAVAISRALDLGADRLLVAAVGTMLFGLGLLVCVISDKVHEHHKQHRDG